MVDFKIQCEHCTGSTYAWFTIAEWRCGVHSVRQLISLLERYYRIKVILSRIPEQSNASGNAVGTAPTAKGIGIRTKHSCYAGITGIRLLVGNEPIAAWCARIDTPERPTPDITLLSNRQIAAQVAGFDINELLLPERRTEPPPSPAPEPAKRRIVVRDAPAPTISRKAKEKRNAAPRD